MNVSPSPKQWLPSIALFFVFLGLALPVPAQTEQEGIRQLLQLAEYIGVDYEEAVRDGRIIDANEYEEMQEFSGLIVEKGRATPAFLITAQQLQDAIENKAPASVVRPLTERIRQQLLALSPQLSLPNSLLPVDTTRALFLQSCAACHGATGQGDGPIAGGLQPPPTDFSDKFRARNRSLLGLYDAISKGLDGTAMPAFPDLSDQQRWSLAFYAGSLAFQEIPAPPADIAVDPQQFVSLSPQTLVQQNPDLSLNDVQALRAYPGKLFETHADPMQITRRNLQSSFKAYEQGDVAQAKQLAVSAYLDGFELIENTLDAHNSGLRRAVEQDFMAYRQLVSQPGQVEAVHQGLETLLTGLERADSAIREQSLSNGALFSASLIILLREGLEALLVVLALGAVLVKTQRPDALKYVHLGWIGALALGVFTWWAASHLISISGASREVMEGVAALLAAAVLFYIGFWMHSKTNASQWQNYINRNINRHLKTGTLWGIAGLSFIAVYREVFETVLFYQSLMTQASGHQASVVLGGFATGVAALVLIGWLLYRYSVKLPIGRFFSLTSWFMLLLAFVLTGKGVAALQEAALIDISSLPVHFSITWLGIYSTWQGLIAQAAVVLLTVTLLAGFRYSLLANRG